MSVSSKSIVIIRTASMLSCGQSLFLSYDYIMRVEIINKRSKIAKLFYSKYGPAHLFIQFSAHNL